MKIDNVKNNTILWEDTLSEETIIRQGLEDTESILNYVQFTPNGVTITLLSLIGYTVLATILIILGIYLSCVPGSAMKCKACCCGCGRKPRVVQASTM